MDLRVLVCAGAACAGAWLGSTPSVQAQSGGKYDLTSSTLDCGSPSISAGAGYELQGTIGQADAGSLTGSGYGLSGGFWRGAALPTDAPPPGTDASEPLVFRLKGNAPNPFSGSTVISFTLPSAAAVGLDLYDLAGRRVRTLVARPLGAGRHQVNWDRRDDSGHEVAHGIYMLRLRAGSDVASRKIALLP
jgi:hypothetical protein